MVSTPRSKNRKDPQTPRSQKKRMSKGRYSDGHWWCNCEPRQKATLREVKKSGLNSGKLFWKCDECNFFLWRDEAKVRETGFKASRSGSDPAKSEPPPMTQQSLVSYGYQVTPSRRQSDEDSADSTESGEEPEPDTPMPKSMRDRTQASVPPKQTAAVETPSRGSSKRRRDVFEEDEDEFSDIGSDEERQMAVIADKSAEKAAQRRFTTPNTTRSADVISGLPTPSVSRTLFPTSESKRQKQVSFEDTPSRYADTMSSATLSANTTPSKTPSRAQEPPSSSPPETSFDVTDEVTNRLRGQKIDPNVLLSVQSILATAARRTKGIILGRDSARANLKAKDEKIATLQERIAALENREKMHRNQMTNIKAGLMKMYDDN
ncbi:DNA topoisomerase 3-alpha [Fusarium austroafricanum]|uniref:DNA topoisomerase 3-alpha n=1 Tax=Fusarium austroafricanum TaxID=2364996 RepID=A0A8H4KHN6_9HYPO|nr:DNA topoisomerase 3-alpha [Fusarium austroafricanum]